jgi:hypothetical protein
MKKETIYTIGLDNSAIEIVKDSNYEFVKLSIIGSDNSSITNVHLNDQQSKELRDCLNEILNDGKPAQPFNYSTIGIRSPEDHFPFVAAGKLTTGICRTYSEGTTK